MYDKLEGVEQRYNELERQLSDPAVIGNRDAYQKAVREHADLGKIVTVFRRYREVFAGIVRKGIEEGSLAPVDADKAAQALMSLAVGIILQGVLDPEGARWDRVIQDTIGMLVEGMGRKPS